jgi:hypothetical protein
VSAGAALAPQSRDAPARVSPWEAFPQVSRVLIGRMWSLLIERMVRSAGGALRTGVPAVSGTTRLLSERAEGKIGSWHRDRLAVVYVR